MSWLSQIFGYKVLHPGRIPPRPAPPPPPPLSLWEQIHENQILMMKTEAEFKKAQLEFEFQLAKQTEAEKRLYSQPCTGCGSNEFHRYHGGLICSYCRRVK